MCLQPREGPFLVGADQPAVAYDVCDVCDENGGRLRSTRSAMSPQLPGGIRLMRMRASSTLTVAPSSSASAPSTIAAWSGWRK
jgi:hypothetical protein